MEKLNHSLANSNRAPPPPNPPRTFSGRATNRQHNTTHRTATQRDQIGGRLWCMEILYCTIRLCTSERGAGKAERGKGCREMEMETHALAHSIVHLLIRPGPTSLASLDGSIQIGQAPVCEQPSTEMKEESKEQVQDGKTKSRQAPNSFVFASTFLRKAWSLTMKSSRIVPANAKMEEAVRTPSGSSRSASPRL